MQNLYLTMTIGNDPHTEGVKKSGRIAQMLGIPFQMLSPEMSNKEKVKIIKKEKPMFLGVSYRLSPEKAVHELIQFLETMEAYNVLNDFGYICFAGLLPTLELLRKYGIDSKYKLHLMGSYSDIERTTGNTIDFFRCASPSQRAEIIDIIKTENEPEKIPILDDIAKDVVDSEKYLAEPDLSTPSKRAMESLVCRIDESSIPVIRTHFGVPSESIYPTVEGITKIANAKVIDELSLGSSDLSQRYYGHPELFVGKKNDGGVPYKCKEDLQKLFLASRNGNYPSVKPYCHVAEIVPFIDECVSIGLLKGAHQAIPLFWFNELDGRGSMKMEESLTEHIKGVKHLANLKIPTEMNDPNQWSSRLAHDAIFVTSYCLISSVMYNAGVDNLIMQCQFNKPAVTGDYADLAKFITVQELVEELRPIGNKARILYECRGGIEHFSSDLKKAKFQLARTTLLQMIINPEILHLVSYCEADHAATAEDIIESSKILRRAVKLFNKHRPDIIKNINMEVIENRKNFLKKEVNCILSTLVALRNGGNKVSVKNYFRYLSLTDVLSKAMEYRIMTAPGIATERYANPSLLTKSGRYGEMDCYKSWNDKLPMREMERIEILRKEYNF